MASERQRNSVTFRGALRYIEAFLLFLSNFERFLQVLRYCFTFSDVLRHSDSFSTVLSCSESYGKVMGRCLTLYSVLRGMLMGS